MWSSATGLAKTLPVIRTWRDRRQYANFLSDTGLHSHYGVFNSFAHARAKLPPSREFNRSELADEYYNIRMHRVYPYDYPIIYWLSRAFADGSTSVFDIGGSVGVHYHAYRKLLVYPNDIIWFVCETPEIAEIGQEIATQLKISNLTFTHSLDTSRIHADIWVSCGALQYIEGARPGRLLAQCTKPPAHIMLNKLPVYDGEDFVAAQNAGKGSYVPQYVYNRSRFVDEIEDMGYQLVDSWDVLERSFYLPSHPEKTFKHFSGMYFKASTTF